MKSLEEFVGVHEERLNDLWIALNQRAGDADATHHFQDTLEMHAIQLRELQAAFDNMYHNPPPSANILSDQLDGVHVRLFDNTVDI